MELKQSLMEVIAQELRQIEDEMDESEDEQELKERFHECPICHSLFLTHGFMLEHMWLQHRHDDDLATPDDNADKPQFEGHQAIAKTDDHSLVDQKDEEKTKGPNKANQSKCWSCSKCDAVFLDDAQGFRAHLIKVHKMGKEMLEDPEKNPLLKFDCNVPQDLKRCETCSECFRSAASLEVHRLRRHVSKASLQSGARVCCPICHEHFDDLTAHARAEHKLDGVICPLCGKILSKTCTLNRHIEQVHLNLQIHKPAQCKECGKVFSKKGHLDRHIRTIHQGKKEGSEPCPICGKVFSTKSSLLPHIEMVHKGVRKKCPECGKVLSDLWKHMRTVHGFYRRKSKIPKDDLANKDAHQEEDLSEEELVVSKSVGTKSRSPRLKKGRTEKIAP